MFKTNRKKIPETSLSLKKVKTCTKKEGKKKKTKEFGTWLFPLLFYFLMAYLQHDSMLTLNHTIDKLVFPSTCEH